MLRVRIIFLTIAVFTCITIQVKSQSIVNAYAKVTAISGNSVITLSNVNQTAHTFAVGEEIIIMQMQDDVVGSNTTNVSSFGNIAAIASAGRFEAKTISARSPASGTPTSITVASTFGNTYNIGSNTSVQIISFRSLGSNYTTTVAITGLAWDGNVGGVIAFQVTNTLTLRHSIIANGIGFIGGAMSTSADEACSDATYITSSNLKAYKGEGIYKNTNANFTNGRGKLTNGGGGGSQNNAGGGGGSNYSVGGTGGLGWACSAGNSGRGVGGLALNSYISGTRVFMGGGGGGGQQNNGLGTDGGDGGGIILIKASAVVSGTTCSSPISISANGTDAIDSGNDGGGGGGAGGSVIIQAASFNLTATCPITVSANGGDGGSVTNTGEHGGGGGGGQGVLVYSGAQPTANVASRTNFGIGGANSSASGSTSASSGGGPNGAGITSGSVTILPIELLDFTGSISTTNYVSLQWHTASEKNCKEFVVERSTDGLDYIEITRLPAHGTTSNKQSYSTNDQLKSDTLYYYRLRSIDFDASQQFSPLIALQGKVEHKFSVQPNPISKVDRLSILLEEKALGTEQIHVLDVFGNVVFTHYCSKIEQTINIELSTVSIEAGIYIVRLTGDDYYISKKLSICN